MKTRNWFSYELHWKRWNFSEIETTEANFLSWPIPRPPMRDVNV